MSQETEKTESATSSPYTKEQRKYVKTALQAYGPALEQGQISYPGERVAPFTTGQQAALGQTEGFLDQFAPQREMPMFGEGASALSGILSGQTGAQSITPEMTENLFRRAYEEPRTRYFEKYERPLAREEYAGPGFWGSARARAVSEKGREMGEWLGEQRGELDWQTEMYNRQLAEDKARRTQAGIDQALAYGREPTMEAGRRLAGTQGVFGALSTEQAQRQMEINANVERFAEEHRITDPENLSILMALLGQPYGGTKTTGATTDPLYWMKFGLGTASALPW